GNKLGAAADSDPPPHDFGNKGGIRSEFSRRPPRCYSHSAMRVGQDVLSDLRAALGMEWVLPHGTGGYSSGTACGANARRAHALLTAAGPHERLTTLLLKVDERLRFPGASFELGCSVLAGGAARPAGHLLLESFTLDPWPRWTWRAGGAALEKSLL